MLKFILILKKYPLNRQKKASLNIRGITVRNNNKKPKMKRRIFYEYKCCRAAKDRLFTPPTFRKMRSTVAAGFLPSGIRMHYLRTDSTTLPLLAKSGYCFDVPGFDRKAADKKIFSGVRIFPFGVFGYALAASLGEAASAVLNFIFARRQIGCISFNYLLRFLPYMAVGGAFLPFCNILLQCFCKRNAPGGTSCAVGSNGTVGLCGGGQPCTFFTCDRA